MGFTGHNQGGQEVLRTRPQVCAISSGPTAKAVIYGCCVRNRAPSTVANPAPRGAPSSHHCRSVVKSCCFQASVKRNYTEWERWEPNDLKPLESLKRLLCT